MKTKILTFLLFGMLSVMFGYGQEYKSAIGGKLGYGLIGSYKTFVSETSAIDLFAGINWWGGVSLGAYYEKHTPIPSLENLQWYWGAGGSFTHRNYGLFGVSGGYNEVGISGVIGLDYSFDDIPLNLSLDYAPTIVVYETYDAINPYNRFKGQYGALTVRYILNK